MSRRPHLAVFLAALATKASVLWALRDHPLLQPAGEMDSAVYLQLARDGVPAVPYFVSPLYVYFLKLMGGSIDAARVVQILLGSVAVVLLFDTASRWFGARAARLTAVLAILCGVITFNEVTVLQSALDPFLVSLASWLLTIAVAAGAAQGAAKRYAASGAAAALFALNRPNALLWIAALGALLLLQRQWRGAVAFAIGCAIVLTPVAARNYVVARELVLVSSHGGLNFYIGNNEAADGTYHEVRGIRPTISGQSIDTKLMAEQATGRSLTSREVSRWFYARAWSWIAANPGAASKLFARKLAYTIHDTDLALNYSYDYFRRDTSSPLRVLLVGPWLLVPLGIAGASTRIRHRRFLTWFAFVPLYALSVAIFFVSSRYRLPLLPLLAIASAGAMHVRRAWQVAVALLFAAVALWPFGLDSGRSLEQTNMVVWLIEHGRAAEAETMLTRVAPQQREPARLRHRAALAYAQRGDVARATPLFEAVLADSSAQPVLRESSLDELSAIYVGAQRYDDARRLFAAVDERTAGPARLAKLARLAMESRNAADAARFLSAAVDREPRPDLWRDLGVAFLAQGDLARALPALLTARDLAPRDAPTHFFLALVHANRGELPKARQEVAQALALQPAFPDAERLRERLE